MPRKFHLFGFLFLLLPLAPIAAQDLFGSADDTVPPKVEAMYTRGLEFLRSTQTDKGNWPDGYGQQPGVVGMAVLAFLAHGEDPNLGPYRDNIRRGIAFILASQSAENGYIGNSMYNHGFAALALAEAYGAVDDDRIGPALNSAVELILSVQARNRYGAWRYSPDSNDADTTVSGACLMALYAARNAGIGIPEAAIARALDFYRLCQTPEGGFGYTGANGPSAPRSAIGALVLDLGHQQRTREHANAYDYLKTLGYAQQQGYWYYYLYYASQAHFRGGDAEWRRWNTQNITTLALLQSPEGSWQDENGMTYATAMGLLSLALNYRFLPIYER